MRGKSGKNHKNMSVLLSVANSLYSTRMKKKTKIVIKIVSASVCLEPEPSVTHSHSRRLTEIDDLVRLPPAPRFGIRLKIEADSNQFQTCKLLIRVVEGKRVPKQTPVFGGGGGKKRDRVSTYLFHKKL